MLRWKLTADWGTEERIKFFRTKSQAMNAEIGIHMYASLCGLEVETKIRETITRK